MKLRTRGPGLGTGSRWQSFEWPTGTISTVLGQSSGWKLRFLREYLKLKANIQLLLPIVTETDPGPYALNHGCMQETASASLYALSLPFTPVHPAIIVRLRHGKRNKLKWSWFRFLHFFPASFTRLPRQSATQRPAVGGLQIHICNARDAESPCSLRKKILH